MSQPDDEPELRDAMLRLREEDRRASPDFDSLWSEALGRSSGARRATRAPGRRLVVRLAWGSAAIALMFVLVLALRRETGGPIEPVSVAPADVAMARDLASWRAPTDSFLEVSGFGIPQGVPSLEFTFVPGSSIESTILDPSRSEKESVR